MTDNGQNGYGTSTLEDSSSHQNGHPDAADQERAPLLSKQEAHKVGKRFRDHMQATVSTTWADVPLLGCYVITGLLDSSATYTWGSFVSMQTGNTIFIGTGIIAPLEDNKWVRALISLVFFCIGTFCFSRFHRYLGGRKRWVLLTSYAVQLAFMIIAAAMVTAGPKPSTNGPLTVWNSVPLGLIAFQSAGQASNSRVMGFTGLTSNVLTSTYLNLFSDEKLFVGFSENVERNRRLVAPVLLLIGAIIGGLWAHSEIGMAGALWTAVGLKFLLIVAWLVWALEKEEE